MDELASQQDGYLGIESVGAPGDRPGEVKSITISYWTTEKSMRAWKRNLEHLGAQKKGKVEWYDRYEVRIGFVERAYSFDRAKDREGGGCD